MVPATSTVRSIDGFTKLNLSGVQRPVQESSPPKDEGVASLLTGIDWEGEVYSCKRLVAGRQTLSLSLSQQLLLS